MKHNIKQPVLALAAVTFAMGFSSIAADSPLPARPPALDPDGRFWVYRNGPTQPPMPFLPYGWMSDATNLTQLIQIDLECRDRPNTVTKTTSAKATTPERDRCIRMKITWGEATWASVAFIAGPDKPPWWGETAGGKYFNLGALPKKKLVFFARGEKGAECIKAQIGALGRKPFGDSLDKPIVSEEIKLTTEWTRYEIDLKDFPVSEIGRICNGFGVVAERAGQSGTAAETQFYIDDVYFE